MQTISSTQCLGLELSTWHKRVKNTDPKSLIIFSLVMVMKKQNREYSMYLSPIPHCLFWPLRGWTQLLNYGHLLVYHLPNSPVRVYFFSNFIFVEENFYERLLIESKFQVRINLVRLLQVKLVLLLKEHFSAPIFKIWTFPGYISDYRPYIKNRRPTICSLGCSL